jgi:hypothetical protein
LPATLLDVLDEAVASPPDPHARSLAIWRITEEILETLQWLHGFDSDHAELASVRRLVEEARAHQDRMQSHPDLHPSGSNQVTRFYPGCSDQDREFP